MLTRSVKKIEPNTESDNKSLFQDYLEIPNIILLGESGSGKSHLFKNSSEYENGKYYTARNFVLYAVDSDENKTIYIDALDEKRSRTDNDSDIEKIIEKIIKIKPSKIRISCRATDWLGKTDLDLFKPYFDENGGYCVIQLEPLNNIEIDYILRENGTYDATSFKDRAAENSIDSLLTNPQTLLMLIALVKNNQFPKNKRELYDKATSLLLTEHNESHQHKELANYSSVQLKDVAGAACTVLLLADIGEISLINSPPLLFYKDISLVENSDAMLAALTKNVFVSKGQKKVNYCHRTIAEYLAACWLCNRVRNGLPLTRVQKLLGFDDYPTLELRGLYAWLTQLLTEYTDVLIKNDPYGVLILGDSSWISSLSSQKSLLKALNELSEKNPWFRAGDWSEKPLGMLSNSSMTNEFKLILSNRENYSLHFRTVILDAIANGESQPKLSEELLKIVLDDTAHLMERSKAFRALIHAVPDGINIIVDKVKHHFLNNKDNFQLKAEIISEIYPNNFNVQDVFQLVNDYINYTDSTDAFSSFYMLAYALPSNDLIEILDKLAEIECDNYQAHSFFSSILKRALNEVKNIEARKLWTWLSAIKSSVIDDVRQWIQDRPEYVTDLFEIALEERMQFQEMMNIGSFLYDFESIVGVRNVEKIIELAFSLIEEKTYCDDRKDVFLFELAISLTVCHTTNFELFTRLVDYANIHPELNVVLENACKFEIPEWRIQHAEREIIIKKNREEVQQQNIADFEKNIDLIRQTKHFGWIKFLGMTYFCLFSDMDAKKTPKERLSQALGENNASIALKVLMDILNSEDVPDYKTIANLNATNQQRYDWWFAILAGMIENWQIKKDINAYSDNVLETVLALIEIGMPNQNEYDFSWKRAIFQHKSELAINFYLEFIGIHLKAGSEHVSALYEICQTENLTNSQQAEIILGSLKTYPKCAVQPLKKLLQTAINLPDIENDFLCLINDILKPRARIELEKKVLWLCAGFLLDVDNFKPKIEKIAKGKTAEEREKLIWTLINMSESKSDLNNSQRIFLIKLVGKFFPKTEFPNDGKVQTGNQNPWDASDFVIRQIVNLSSKIDEESIADLNQLINCNDLCSYRDNLKYYASNQAALCRQQTFKQPDWKAVVSLLSNGKTANMADFQELAMEHLKDVAKRIRNENTDIFKVFWNEDSHGRIITNNKKVEESCRDRLIDLLRPRFLPLEINVEPEGHMVNDKRADIVLLGQPQNS